MSPLSLLVSHWSLEGVPVAGVVLAAAAYSWGVTRVRGARMRGTRVHAGWPVRRTACFMAGLGAVLVALCSGLGSFDDQLLSAHMLQHLFLLVLAPLLLLAGRPMILALRALPRGPRRTVARAVTGARRWTGPVPCLAAFTTIVLLTHLPSFYDAAVEQPALHWLEHILYLVAGSLLWWPLLDGDPVPSHRLGGLGRLGYLIAAMVPMSVIGAWLDRDPTLAYHVYAAPARGLGVSALSDQASAGAIMWVAGSVLMVLVGLWVATAALVAEERRQQALDRREVAL